MTWTPEMIYGTIVAVGTGCVAIAGALNKAKIVKIPLRRNNGNNQFSGMSVSDIEKRCREIHGTVELRLTELDKGCSQRQADIRHIEGELDRGEKKFNAIHLDIRTIITNQGIQGAKFEAREKELTDTITDATQIMRELLQKSG